MADRLELKNHSDRPVIVTTSTETLTLPPNATLHVYEALIAVKPATAVPEADAAKAD